VITTTTTAYPLMQPYTSVTFPPTNWSIGNPDADVTWVRAGNVGAYSQAPLGTSKLDFYTNNPAGHKDNLYGAPVDMTATTGNSYLTFDVAYARYSAAYSDSLSVAISTDCGQTWTQVYMKGGTTLATAPDNTNAFTPSAAQWRHEVISTNSYNGQASVIVRFTGHSGFGNNLYVDNVNISSSSSVVDLLNNVSLNIYPNPMKDNATIDITLANSDKVSIIVYNMLGETVKTIDAGTLSAGSHSIQMNASTLDAGVYFVKVISGQSSVSKKVVLEK
jgi:hypothetical protein